MDSSPVRPVGLGGTVEQTVGAGPAQPPSQAGDTSAAVTCSGRERLPSDLLPLRTAAEAAQLLAVRESWLRRKAAARAIPCTFLGKHLRFSPADLAAITTAAAQAPRTRSRAPRHRPRRR
jgi:excisionase family DNA binding protein